jgi:hypothetical protein
LPEGIARAISTFIGGGASKVGPAALGITDVTKEAEAAGLSRGRYVASKIGDTSTTDVAFNLGAALRRGLFE